ncbi:hypothetical protein MPSEU_001071000 [Mayamaea pseudoterrestris]|nr:hypothetical protein MPSEU_001071000 [Mayamaea pseudoterrestris]
MEPPCLPSFSFERHLQEKSIHRLLEQRRRDRRARYQASSANDYKTYLTRQAYAMSNCENKTQSPPNMEELLRQEWYHWRTDPLTSKSDWILEVRVDPDKPSTSDDGCAKDLSLETSSDDDSDMLLPVELYHVHKAVLKRRSKYLARVVEASAKSACELHLPPIAASVVPVWLDCMYGVPLILQSPQSAVGLHHLAGLLDTPDIRQAAMEYIQNNISLQNVHLYYKHAGRVYEQDIVKAAANYVGRKIRRMDWSVPLIDECRATFWAHVLPYCACSRRASLFVAMACARDHSEQRLDAALFQNLTRRKYLPEIDARVACTLLRIEAELASTVTRQSSNLTMNELTCLQRRCFASLAKDWLKITPETLSFLTKNVPAKLLELLMVELDHVSDGHSVVLPVLANKANRSSQISVVSSVIDDMNNMLSGPGKYAV